MSLQACAIDIPGVSSRVAMTSQHQLQCSTVQRNGSHRGGFTLLELLIAVSVMLILLAITATALRITNEADRVRAGGRQVQSYLLGAKDRAIYAKAPRGVRFLRGGTGTTFDPNDRGNRLVTSMVYVEPTEPWGGSVRIGPVNTALPWDSATNQMRRVRLPPPPRPVPDWAQLRDRGLLVPGLRIRIPGNSRGDWYLIQAVQIDAVNQDLILSTEYRHPLSSGEVLTKAVIELPPSVMPNAEIVQLPRGVAIDLDRSRIPAVWGDGAGGYNSRMDLMFSPRGTVTGLVAGTGVVHLYLTDTANLAGTPLSIAPTDVGPGGLTYQQIWDPGYGAVPGYGATPPAGVTIDLPVPDKIITSIFTRTGNVSCSPVRADDGNPDAGVPPNGFADDPFFFAERGEVAGR